MTLSDTPINESAMSFEYDVLSDRWICAPDLKAMYGVPHGAEMTTEYMAGRMVHDDRDLMLERFAFHLSNTGPFQYEFRIHDHANRVRHLVLVGNSEGAGDEVKRMSGYLVDITESLREQTTAAVAASAEHRAVIEQSKGILMAGFNLSADAAFALLRRCSNQHNVKLVTVAQRVIDTISDASFTRDAAAALRRLLTDWT